MKILDVFNIAGRGRVIVIQLDGDEPSLGSVVTRRLDGARWIIAGVEWFALPAEAGPKAGHKVGLLLRGDAVPVAGDEVTLDGGPQMTPPDSDAREVCGVNWNPNLGPHYPCALPAGHEGRHEYLAAEAMAVLPLSLAQRILAALESHALARDCQMCRPLATELRERMGQKP